MVLDNHHTMSMTNICHNLIFLRIIFLSKILIIMMVEEDKEKITEVVDMIEGTITTTMEAMKSRAFSYSLLVLF